MKKQKQTIFLWNFKCCNNTQIYYNENQIGCVIQKYILLSCFFFSEFTIFANFFADSFER